MRAALLLISILFFWSCRTPQQLSESQQLSVTDKTQVDLVLNHEVKTVAETTSSRTIEESEHTTIKTKTIEFDTDKAKDPETGMHPVKSITEAESTTDKGKKEASLTDERVEQLDKSECIDNSKIDIKAEEKRTLHKKKQLPAIVWYAASALVFAILIFVFKNRIKGFFLKFKSWL